MNPTLDVDDAVALLTTDPAGTGIFCDFDGTLSEIVEMPNLARPVPGASVVLEQLATAFGAVVIVSGRSLDDLAARFSPERVILAGSYGREKSDRPVAVATREWDPVAAAAMEAASGWPGVVVEQKDGGVALHYRLAPPRAADVGALAGDLAERFGLQVRPGRMVAELTEPGPGKGEALAALLADHALDTFMFAGDDFADGEAFAWARASGRRCVLVGVRSDESPAIVVDNADLLVTSPADLVRFLERLLQAVRRPD